MKQKTYNIIHLPEEITSLIFNQLEKEKDKSNLALTSRMFGKNRFFRDMRIKTRLEHYMASGKINMLKRLLKIRPDLHSEIRPMLQPILFQLVGRGEEDKVKSILTLYPDFFYTYASLTDISGIQPRINKQGSKGITVFQHALWAGDIHHMCNTMLDCLPKTNEGKDIKVELLRQYTELMSNGVTYELDGKLHHQNQFDLKPFADALSDYADNFYSRTEQQRINLWCTHIGSLQKHLPAIIRHHYCNPDRPFWEQREFNKKKLTRSLLLTKDKKDKKPLYWDENLTSLGKDFAIVSIGCAENNACAHGEDVKSDLLALFALYAKKEKIDRPALIKRLENPTKGLKEESGFLHFAFK